VFAGHGFVKRLCNKFSSLPCGFQLNPLIYHLTEWYFINGRNTSSITCHKREVEREFHNAWSYSR